MEPSTNVVCLAGGPYSGAIARRVKKVQPDPAVSRAALLPLALVLVFALHYALDLSFAMSAAASVPFVLLFVLAPVWVNASRNAFDRDAVGLLAARRAAGLGPRYRRALGLRLFGSVAERAARRAMVAAENNEPEAARALFRRSIGGWEDPANAPFAVKVGLAHACYRAGAHGEAIIAYRGILEDRGPLPRVRQRLAHAMLEEGKALRDAIEVIDRAETEASDPTELGELALLRAWALTELGQKKKAQRLFKAHQDLDTELANKARAACGS